MAHFDNFVPTVREQEILERCVPYSQYKELEDLFDTLRRKHNELVDHLAANGSGDRIKILKVTETEQ